MSDADKQKEIDDKIAALKASKFKQQMLPAWRPVPSFGSTMITFSLFGIVFLTIGIVLYVMSDKIQEVKFLYSSEAQVIGGVTSAGCGKPTSDPPANAQFNLGNMNWNASGKPNVVMADKNNSINPGVAVYPDQKGDNQCERKINITTEMKAPIFVYYQLDNFYQNHRRYVKSKNYKQLMGETVEKLSDCDPIATNKSLNNAGIQNYYQGYADGKPSPLLPTKLVADGNAIPCGLIAKSVFTDSYKLQLITDAKTTPVTKTTIDIDQTGIAWQSDIDYKFKNQLNDDEGKAKWMTQQWINVEQEHFIVWMRTAGLPNFRKLWGKINKDLKESDEYMLTIQNNYKVDAFSGNKSFVLSTTNMLGGQNYFLAICYIVVGALCLVFAIIFFVAYIRKSNMEKQAVQ